MNLVTSSHGNPTHPWMGVRGLGDDSQDQQQGPSNQQIAQGATQGVAIGLATQQKTGSVVAGTVAGGLTLAATFDPEPFSKAALTIAAALTGVITAMFKGCGPTCTDASNYVNQAEPYFVQNRDNYVSQPVRYASMQAQALANFDNAYASLAQKCQQIGGQGGANCIKDRQAGACKWKASPGHWNSDGTYTVAGKSGSGDTCWNWYVGYRDPIANDPYVQPDPVTSTSNSISSAISSLFTGGSASGGSGVNPLLLLAGGALALWAVME
jgi:hypothetical protein